MWESRDRPRHYVSSKVMCWLALDRAIDLADRLGPGADIKRWTASRDEIRTAILERAWSESAGSFAGAFDSDELDASVLLMPLVGFIPATDPRMHATIDTIDRELTDGRLVRRWRDDDSGFLICTFWLAESLALAGDIHAAHTWFDSASAHANDLGLMAEEAAPGGKELLGNFPQAFSHVGLINAAWRLDNIATAVTGTTQLDVP
jgi:GH15 family glucan-1,4-alpha-glucosidase